jgi:hypothetical protein
VRRRFPVAELAFGNREEIREAPDTLSGKQVGGVLVSEGNNHAATVCRLPVYGKGGIGFVANLANAGSALSC